MPFCLCKKSAGASIVHFSWVRRCHVWGGGRRLVEILHACWFIRNLIYIVALDYDKYKT